ncbi:MAG: hypothetical protein ABI992_11970, partial [Chthoniobacterales bacterium]
MTGWHVRLRAGAEARKLPLLEIVRWQTEATPAILGFAFGARPPLASTMKKQQNVEIDGHRLTVSNLDKVFFPETGFTKGEVIAFYSEIADTILPHLR